MQVPPSKKIVWLSNVYDHHYTAARGEQIVPCLSSAKRRDLFKCAEVATGRPVLVLSSPPKPASRRRGKWLPAVHSRFSTHAQFFCPNWDAPKIRVPLSWVFYAWQALQHTRRGDLVVMDNYEFIYVVAAWCLKIFRGAQLVLEYEDGKHLIDKSWGRVLSGLAELLGRPLVRAAFVSHPALAARLPANTPSALVPGFVIDSPVSKKQHDPGCVRFLYSGSLDSARGIDVLLAALPFLLTGGWHLHITGAGPLETSVQAATHDPRWSDKMTFHGVLPATAVQELAAGCDVGLNCQKVSDPVSQVTFPSKIFSYLSSGLLIISSRASQVDRICERACAYYEQDDPKALALLMSEAIADFERFRKRLDFDGVKQRHSMEGTAARMKKILFDNGREQPS